MRMRFIAIGLTLVLLACGTENDIAPKVASGTLKNSNVVSLNDARKVALVFAKRNFSFDNSESDINPKIKNEMMEGTVSNPYFYIFNFDKGFAIVSAERFEHPILAFSSNSSFQIDDAPDGILNWIAVTRESIDKIRNGEFDTRKQTSAEWYTLEKNSIPATPVGKVAPPEPGCQETSTTTTVGPLVTTTWNQGCGYNAACPLAATGPCGRAYTGCVATAMAQVMRYWQKPTFYNWAIMPTNSGNAEVARLMNDVGTSVGMNYGGDGSGAPHENIPGGLKNTFGYTSASNIDYGISSYNTVKSNISARRPVLLSGYNVKNSSWLGLVVSYHEGHEWVCDGYMETSSTWCNEDGSFGGGATYLSFHMNWGWGGTADGWYGFDNWAPYGQGYNFKYYRRAIVNIYP